MKIQSLLACLAFLAGCAQSKTPPDVASVNQRIDSLVGEMRMLNQILTAKGLDVERERQRILRQDSAYNIPLEGSAIFGDPKAPLTVVLFTDLQCPYCAQIVPVLKSLQASHPKTLKISFRHFPLVSIHEKAMFAHQALWAAGQQGKLWDYYFLMAPNFRGLTDSALVANAKAVNLDMARFETDRKSPASQKAIEADMQLGETVGVEGTPALYFNGKPTRNPAEINEAAAKADAGILPAPTKTKPLSVKGNAVNPAEPPTPAAAKKDPYEPDDRCCPDDPKVERTVLVPGGYYLCSRASDGRCTKTYHSGQAPVRVP